MANAGFIVVKNSDGTGHHKTYRDFYGPHDKGSAKPSFCYPSRKRDLVEEVDKTEKAIANGYISPERIMEAKVNLKTKKTRLEGINQQEADARKLFEANKDAWMKRREALATEISESMPTLNDTKKRRVNPFTTLKKEKSGLEDKKREFIVLSRLAGEESNIQFLQREG